MATKEYTQLVHKNMKECLDECESLKQRINPELLTKLFQELSKLNHLLMNAEISHIEPHGAVRKTTD